MDIFKIWTTQKQLKTNQVFRFTWNISILLFSVCVCFQKVHLALSGKTSRFYPKLVRIDSIDTWISEDKVKLKKISIKKLTLLIVGVTTMKRNPHLMPMKVLNFLQPCSEFRFFICLSSLWVGDNLYLPNSSLKPTELQKLNTKQPAA